MSIFYELIKSWLCFDTTTTFIARICEKSPFISCIIADFSEGRVHYLIDGDYSENSEADRLIKEFIISYK